MEAALGCGSLPKGPADATEGDGGEGVQGAESRPLALPVAFSQSLGGEVPMDPEVVAVCRVAAARFARLVAGGSSSSPSLALEEGEGVDGWLSGRLAGAEETFQALRAHQFAASMAELVSRHREQVKPEVAWNVAKGLEQGPEVVREAMGSQAALEAAFDALFERFGFLCLPSAMLPPFSAEVPWIRALEDTEAGPRTFSNYAQWLAATSVVTLSNCPAVSVPCGFTASGLPVGLQIVGPRNSDERLLAAAALLERDLPYAAMVPLDPRSGTGQMTRCS